MANYAFVQNGDIVYTYDILPQTWNNISNFNVLEFDHKIFNALGWFHVKKRIPQFNLKTQKLSAPKYTLDNNLVYEDYDVIQITSEEQLNINKKQNFMKNLRQIRNNLLFESDWTQNADVQEDKSEEWKSAWKIYRKQLRDLPLNYDNFNITDIGLVKFPNKPK